MKLHQTFRLEEQTIKEAQLFAIKENRSLSNVYATAVTEFLKSKKKAK